MPLQLVCACGNQLRVPEAHAGRRVQCPRCGAAQVVPERQPAAAPAPRPAGHPGPRQRLWLLLLLVPLVLALAAAGWWFLHKDRRAALDEDLSLIPADAPAFISIRLREILATPLGQEVLFGPPRVGRPGWFDFTTRVERATGLDPEEIERVSVVSVDLERRIGWGVLKTAEPYDAEKVRSVMRRTREASYQGKKYFTGNDWEEDPVALHFVSPTVLVISNEEGVKGCIAHSRSSSRGAKGALSPVLALCDGSRHLVAGLNLTAAAREQIERNADLAGLTDLRLVQLTGQVNTEAVFEARAQTASEERAKKAHGTVQTGITAASFYLFGLSLKGGDQGKLAKLGTKLLGRLKVEQEGSDLTASLTADAATVSAALELLPGALGR